MEVINKNFDELLPEIESSIERAIFVAIDCEYSGLNVSDDKDNCFESMEERYKAVRKSASQFLVLQFGLCSFFYDPVLDQFSHQAYNFYTFPRQFSSNAPNIRFLSESSSLHFLASCGFDFNKLIYEGIPYLTFANEEKMEEDFEKRQLYLSSEENSTPLPVPENLKKFMESTNTRIKRFLSSSLTELNIENVSPFQRKLVFHNLKPKYSKQLYFETIVVNEATETVAVAEDGDGNESSSSSDSKDITNGIASSQISTNKNTVGAVAPAAADTKLKETDSNTKSSNKTKASRGDTKTRILRIVKLSSNEQSARNDEKRQVEMDNIRNGVGFSKVIRKISNSGKLVVGHNMLLDVSHTVHQFVDELPDNLAEYKCLVQKTFPNLIDTKYMACTNPFKEYISSTILFDVVKTVQEPPFALPVIKKECGERVIGYDLSDRKKHEAGFDAFITGAAFIAMCQYLGEQHVPKKRRLLPDSPLVMPFLNKLYMMRMSDITYLNISGTDLTPSRSHVFYVTCPKDASAKSIQQIFQPFGTIQIWWKNQQSLFVALNDKDQSSLVMSNIECASEYRVIPFSTYQKQQQQKEEKKRPLALNERSPERAGDIFRKLVTDKSPPPLEHKKKRPKTELRRPLMMTGGGEGVVRAGMGPFHRNNAAALPVTAPPGVHFEEPATWN